MPDEFMINKIVTDDRDEDFVHYEVMRNDKHFCTTQTLREARAEIEAYTWVMQSKSMKAA